MDVRKWRRLRRGDGVGSREHRPVKALLQFVFGTKRDDWPGTCSLEIRIRLWDQ